MTAIFGGKFWSGFAAGALSSIAASAWGGGHNVVDNGNYTMSLEQINGLGAGTGDLGTIAFGTVAGGAGAALTGSNFWQGAVTGLVVSGLNHVMHQQDGPDDPPAKKQLTQDEIAQAEGWTNSEFKRLYELNESWLEARTFFATFELKLPELKMPSWSGIKSAFGFGGKGYSSFNAFKAANGAAGSGMAWHHIVEQGGSNIAKFGATKIHNTTNLVRLKHGAGSMHAKISGYYSSKQAFTGGQTVRQWLSGQSYKQQYDFGIKTMKQFGWKP